MTRYEYKAVPAPLRGTKAKGLKTTEDRFALSLTETLNEMAEDGWDYLRAETLPCEERKGLTGTQVVYQNMLIFRRLTAEAREPLTLARPVSMPAPGPEGDGAPARARLTSRPPEAGKAPRLTASRED